MGLFQRIAQTVFVSWGRSHPAQRLIADAVLNMDKPNVAQLSVLKHLEACKNCSYDAIPILSSMGSGS